MSQSPKTVNENIPPNFCFCNVIINIRSVSPKNYPRHGKSIATALLFAKPLVKKRFVPVLEGIFHYYPSLMNRYDNLRNGSNYDPVIHETNVEK